MPAEPTRDPGWLSDARYRAVVEDQTDLVVRFLPDGTLTFANSAYCAFFGVHRDEVVGRQYQPIVHADDVLDVQAQVAALTPEHPVVRIENRVYRADGAVRWTEWSTRALYDDHGQLVELQATGRDVTERREAALTTARLAAIVESADVAIYSTTLDGVITSWNRAAERMFGYATEEAVGRPIGDLLPESIAYGDDALVRRLVRGEVIDQLDVEKTTKSGRRLPVALTLSPILDVDGRVMGVSRIARDTTERVRARRELEEREGRFRLMADHAPVLIWMADTENRGVYFNRPWLEFTGVPLEAQLGDGWLSLVHPDDAPLVRDYRQRQVEQRSPFTTEFRLRHATGTYRWIQDMGQPLFLPDGTFSGYIGSCLDIDARKQLADAQASAVRRESEARAAAEEASHLKDEFLAVVSHELRTPLNAILGWTRLLCDGTIPPDATAAVFQTIERNARAQAQLVEDLLDVSRFMSGKLPMRREAVDLTAVVRSAVSAVQPATGPVAVGVHIEDGPLIVMGDAGRLQQAVWNLLANATKFTPAGGTVDVNVTRRADRGVVTVRDTGEGIAPEVLPYIFDRFRQAAGGTTRAHGGLGLGLAIVQHVVQAHQGSVHAASDGIGHGAAFAIELPLAMDRAADAPKAPSRTAAGNVLRGYYVLVVDDDRDARDLAGALLEARGAEVTAAPSVSAAVAAAARRLPDIVIGDIGMPDQDGYDLIRQLRAVPGGEGLHAIAVTAYAGTEHRDRALSAGYDAHLSKPIDTDALCARIVELVGAARRDGQS